MLPVARPHPHFMDGPYGADRIEVRIGLSSGAKQSQSCRVRPGQELRRKSAGCINPWILGRPAAAFPGWRLTIFAPSEHAIPTKRVMPASRGVCVTVALPPRIIRTVIKTSRTLARRPIRRNVPLIVLIMISAGRAMT